MKPDQEQLWHIIFQLTASLWQTLGVSGFKTSHNPRWPCRTAYSRLFTSLSNEWNGPSSRQCVFVLRFLSFWWNFFLERQQFIFQLLLLLCQFKFKVIKIKKPKLAQLFEAWAQDSIWRPFILDEYILCFYYYYKCHCTRWAQKTVEGREKGDRLHKAGSGQSLNQSKANLHRNNCRANALPRERHTNSTNPISSTSSSGNLIGALKSQLAGRRTEDEWGEGGMWIEACVKREMA